MLMCQYINTMLYLTPFVALCLLFWVASSSKRLHFNGIERRFEWQNNHIWKSFHIHPTHRINSCISEPWNVALSGIQFLNKKCSLLYYLHHVSFPGWWITNWNLLHIASNQISTHSFCNNLYLCIFKLWVLMAVIKRMDWFW